LRTASRLLSTAVAVGAIFPIGTMPAHADSSPVLVETAAWFWSSQTSGSVPQAGVPYPAVPASTSGVPDGDLAVAYKGETETKQDGTKVSVPDKETYLAWDIYFIPEGSYVDSFTFTMFVDTAAHNLIPPKVDQVPGQTPRGGQPPIVACVPSIGFGEGYGDSFDVKPADDCTDEIIGQYDATKNTYTFDATVYAQDWVDGKDNFGLAIRSMEDEDDPFQLSFLGKAKVTASISYTPVEEQAEVPPYVPPVALPPLPSTGNTGVVSMPQPQPQPQAPPVVVVEPRKPVAIRPVAASPLRSSRALTSVFWFALLGGVLLLGTASLILGDPLEPAAATGTKVRAGGRYRLNIPAGAPARVTGPARPRTV
jgi:hypothetical protein